MSEDGKDAFTRALEAYTEAMRGMEAINRQVDFFNQELERLSERIVAMTDVIKQRSEELRCQIVLEKKHYVYTPLEKENNAG